MNKTPKHARITVRFSQAALDDFKAVCREKESNPSDTIRRLVTGYIGGAKRAKKKASFVDGGLFRKLELCDAP